MIFGRIKETLPFLTPEGALPKSSSDSHLSYALGAEVDLGFVKICL